MKPTDHYCTTLPASVHIRLDDQPMEVPADCSLAQLLSLLGRAPDSIATARNGDFVPREARDRTVLLEGDQILLFRPIVGG
ncbi:sulfur carrier protein ThiS [Paucibacter sp. APW11]|uniref:Sulfur carrier protein ThiS n=1 Tax=Roseateles aquae TaxID=3077235 RepID=A0ABU3PF28_9BURK|nr:sulfur carrier protein ThiS [Paucibacter sp. APW11]MDT9000772.1 sulfur carrier protein ThiS [Paucibacter sp. APW11]